MRTLLLRAVDVSDETTWRWLLSDEDSGALLAEQRVALDPASPEYEGFGDLVGYLRWHAIPDRRSQSEAALLAGLGGWMGRHVLGAVGPVIAVAPATVRVALPAELRFLLDRPLGLAYVDGVPVAERAGLVFGTPGERAPRQRPKQPVADRLRMLAVFSMPTASAGSLRRERYELSHLIRSLGSTLNAAIELRVLQYGVTRERLQAVLEEGEGWDVVHLSGHGSSARSDMVLGHADGSPDPLMTDELVGMLRLSRSRLKLVVISNNRLPAIGLAERRRYLGFTEFPDADYPEAGRSGGAGHREPGQSAEAVPGTPLPALALTLAERLECAVVASRYPLAEETTVAFNNRLYGGMFEGRRNVAGALSAALGAVGGIGSSAALLAVASPILIGSLATDLAMVPPKRASRALEPVDARMACFPGEPARFVGRDSVMAQASAALAPESGRSCVLLHGLAGAGKTACALELAYRHADGFEAAVWWQAPVTDSADAALPGLATALETQLTGFSFNAGLSDPQSYQRHLRGLTALLEDRAVLMVLDGLDTLVTPGGEWRDPRWGELIRALAEQQGESRVILTGRVPLPAYGNVLVLPVHNLSLDESIELADELPNLRRLLHVGSAAAEPGAGETGPDAEVAGRERALRVLRLVQGHPALMELADAAAVDPGRLDAQLAAAEEAAVGESLEAFFGDGASAMGPDRVLDALTAWTMAALAALPPAPRLMAEFVTCLEDTDRRSDVIDANWANLWRRLTRPGDPPAPDPLLKELAEAALVTAEQAQAPSGAEVGPALVTYRVHPSVAAAITGAVSKGVSAEIDAELAAFWGEVFRWAREHEGGEDSGLVVRAGLAAAPYLLRQQQWDTASFLLAEVAGRDGSPGLAQAVLPSLRRIAAATGAPANAGVLAGVLMRVDRAEAERLLRDALNVAAREEDFRIASVIAGDLVNLLVDAGRLGEALAVAELKAEFTRRAGLGPWTQLGDEAQRLQVLGRMGDHAGVLAEAGRLRAAMTALPARGGPDEAVEPWNVREVILSTGRSSALATGEWALCLELNAEVVASVRGRGAGVHEVTLFRFNDAGPLIRLGRLGEAGRLLAECQRVFEDHADTASLARVLSARANLEGSLGRPGAAAELERAALRLRYARPEPRDIAISHHNLATYLGRLGAEQEARRAHRLAAAIIYRLSGMAHDLADTIRTLASELHEDGGADPSLPSTVAEVVNVAEQTEGVRLAALLAALRPDPQAAETALSDILRTAAEPPPEPGVPGTRAVMDE